MPLEQLFSSKSSERVSLPQWLDRGIVLAVLLACGVALSLNIVDPDLWGHVQYGRDALRDGLPATTTYSYLAEGYPWINHEILAEYALAIGNDWLGGPGLLIAKCLLGLGVVGLILQRAFQQGVSLIAGCMAALFVAVCLGTHWSLRPQVFSYVSFALLLAILSYCFEGWEGRWQWPLASLRKWRGWQPDDFEPLEYSVDRLRMLWLVPLLMVFWTNAHGGFLAGLCIYIAYLGLRAGEAYLHKGRGADGLAKRFGLMAAAAALATLLNPYGLLFHRWLFHDLRVPRPEIVEWRSPDPLDPQTFPFLILLALWVASLALSRRSKDLTHQIILGLIAWQACLHLRHIAFFAIAFGWWMPVHLDSMLKRLGMGKRFQTEEEVRFGWAPPEDPAFTASLSPHLQKLFGVLLVFAISVGGGQLVYRLCSLNVERDKYPADAFYYIAQEKLTGKMVCTFNWAQYALAAFGPQQTGDPGILVQVDGRCRTSYSQEMLDTHFDFIMGPLDPSFRYRDDESGPVDPLRALHVGRPDLVLISRYQEPSVVVMQSQQDEWILLYQDRLAQLWGRKSRYDDPQSAYYLPPPRRAVGEFAPRGFVPWPALPDYRPDSLPNVAASTP
ncbi:MAG: hypothetical protein WD872_06955 [Pirellulaceae bacterium]